MEKVHPFANNDSYVSTSPQVLGSYPKIQKDNEELPPILNYSKNQTQNSLLSSLREQCLYLSNIQLICFPDGYYVDVDFEESKLRSLCGYDSGLSHHRSLSEHKLQHFTITQSSGEKKYLTSISYYEVALVEFEVEDSMRRKVVIMPKCLCLVSRLPLFSIQKQMLEFMHEDVVKRFHSSLLEQYSKLETNSDSFQSFKECYQRAKSNNKVEGRIEFYLSAFFHHLKIDGTNLEIEIYKKSSRVHQSGQDSQQKKTVLRYVNTFNKECLRLENYDYRLLFQKVGPTMLMQMFVCLLHERKIILIHNDSSKNAILIETLISLLYPLQWNFTNISYLIPSMVEYLEAPFPYIVGVPRDLWKLIYEQKWDVLGEEVVAFDIDNARVFNKEELPEFPQPYTSMLIEQLKKQIENGKKISARGRQQQARLSAEAFQKEEDRFWNHFTLKVKQQFVNFLIFVINNFESFYIQKKDMNLQKQGTHPAESMMNLNAQQSTLDSSRMQQQNSSSFIANGDKNPQSSYNGGNFQGGSANDIFDFEEYIQNFKDNQSFFEKFLRTQAFINFIEQAFYEEQGNLSDASIRFFKDCTRKLSSENLQALRAMQDSMIQGLIHKFSERSISYSIDKCHLIYEKTLQQLNSLDETTQSPSQLSSNHLVQSLDHSKIIRMQLLDPTKLIEQRFSKASETLFDVETLQKQRRDNSLLKKESLQFPHLQESQLEEDCSLLYKDNLNIFLQDSNQTADRRQVKQIGDRANAIQFGTNEAASELSLMLQQPSFNTNNVPDYFTVQATPINSQSRANFGLDLDRNNMNKTTNLIKIEDDYDGQAFEESRIMASQDHSLNQIEYSPQHQAEMDDEGHSSSEEKETAGFLGFFKKTFSSVKKTFESTFNPRSQGREGERDNKFLKSKSQQRPAAKSTYSQQRPTGLFGFMTGSNTPDLIINESQDKGEESESPEIIGNKRRTAAFGNGEHAKVQNRAARSLTFHSKEASTGPNGGAPLLLWNGNQSQRNQNNANQTLDEKAEQSKQNAVEEKPVKRDRKANNSFFASLWNLGSQRKNKQEDGANDMRQIQSLSPQKNQTQALKDDQIVMTKKNRNRTLNGSGFFVFNEEDMKHMTEMSPQNLLLKQHSAQTQIKVLKFEFHESQLSQRQSHQQPLIKNPPVLDAQQNSLLSRLRSISHQNQTQPRHLVASLQNSSHKPQSRRQDNASYVSHSLSKREAEDNSQTMFQNYQTLFIDSKSNPQPNRQTFAVERNQYLQEYAANGGFSPIEVEDIDSRNNNEFRNKVAPQHLVFSLEEENQKLTNFLSTPKYQTHQSAKQRDSRVNKDEFEQIYKQSTEMLLYPPLSVPQNPPATTAAPTLSKSSSKEKFTMWKSQTSKINIKGMGSAGSLSGLASGNLAHYSYTLSSNGNNQTKSKAQKPPKHHYKVVKKNSMGSTTLNKPSKSLTSNHHNHNNSMTTNAKTLQQQLAKKEEKLALQRSLTSDLCNDRNSTDEDLSAPISALTLLQFQNVMQNSKAFDKMNLQSTILNTTQTVKLDYEDQPQRDSKPADQKVLAAPTVTNFSLQNKGIGKSNQHSSQNNQKLKNQPQTSSLQKQALSHQNAHSKHQSAGVMQSLGVHAAVAQPAQGIKAKTRHKRQLSNGMQSVQVVGEPSIQQPLIENIEPDEDCQQLKQFDKQIESMQLGRVRKKSSNKASIANQSSHLQNRTNTHHQYHNSAMQHLTRKNSSALLNQSAQVQNQGSLNTSQVQANNLNQNHFTGSKPQANTQNLNLSLQKQSMHSTTQKRVQKQVAVPQKISNFISQANQQPQNSIQTQGGASLNQFNDTNQQLQEVLKEMNLKGEKGQQKDASKIHEKASANKTGSNWRQKQVEEKKQVLKQQPGKSNQNSSLVASRNQKGGLDLQARIVASAEESKLFGNQSSQSKTVELSATWLQLSQSRTGERGRGLGEGGGTFSKMSQSRQNAALPVKTIESSSQESMNGEEEDMECLREEEEQDRSEVINLEQEDYNEKANASVDQSSKSLGGGRRHSQNSMFVTIANQDQPQPNLMGRFNNINLEQHISIDNSRSKTIERKSHLNPLPLKSVKKRSANQDSDSPIHSQSSYSPSQKNARLNKSRKESSEDFMSEDFEAQDEDFIESLANREQNSSSYINAINQSVDFRDSKRREAQGNSKPQNQSEIQGIGVISPTHQIRKFNEQSKGGFISSTIVDKDSFAMRMASNQQSAQQERQINLRQSMQNHDHLRREVEISSSAAVQGRVHSQSYNAKLDPQQLKKNYMHHQGEYSLSPKQKVQMDYKIPSPNNNLHQRNQIGNQRGYLPSSSPQSRLQIMAAATHSQKPIANSLATDALQSVSSSKMFKDPKASHTSQLSPNYVQNPAHHQKNYPSNSLQVNLHRHHPSEQPAQHQQPMPSNQIPHGYYTSSNQGTLPDKQQKPHAQYQQHPPHKINIPNHSQKPLNKVALDAFSQIAKLSGDVDHEPHTPKSGGLKKARNLLNQPICGSLGGNGGQQFTTEEIESMSDCEDVY